MTDKKKFENHKRQLIKHHLETVGFLSNKKKSERERCVCAAFLRCLGTRFSVAELLSVPQRHGPPDVIFRKARFEVCDSLSEGRKPHDEARARVERSKMLKNIKDLDVPFTFPAPATYSELYSYVADELTKKALKYGMSTCANLDALVHIRRHVFLQPDSSLPSCSLFGRQGWRSVSFVVPPYSHVIHTAKHAPDFLRAFAGKTMRKWSEPDTFYNL
jgi:hypothetical protein